MCVLVVCGCSLQKCIFRAYTHLVIGLFFLILSSLSCLNMLEMTPLSVASSANSVAHYVGRCLS